MKSFKENPPARIKRKAEKQRLEKEEAKRLRVSEEQPNQSAIDPTTGQFVTPAQQQPQPAVTQPPTSTAATPSQPPVNGGGGDSTSSSQPSMNGDIKENGDVSDHHDDLDSNDAKLDTNNPPTSSSPSSSSTKSTTNKIMLSGFVKSQSEELQSMLESLGAEITSQAKLATHLVMPKMCRTISFLCAMSYVKYILKPEWITDSHKEKKLLGML